jgi:hypothetical protein
MEPNVLETAKLVLRSGSSTLPETNNQGFTWNNIDLRQVLGDMYDRYELFKLTFIQLEISGLTGFTTQDEGLLFLNITGLEWENCSYNYATNTQEPTARCAIIFMADGTQTSQPPYTTMGLTFRKNKPLCNIRLNYTKTTNGIALSNKSLPVQQGFHFVITPIE